MPMAADHNVGVSLNLRDGTMPVNGLRHPPEGRSSGWYFWGGLDPSQGDDFFKPLHAGHLPVWCPAVEKFLALPPGWRFLIVPTDGYEDVWFDEELLKV
jgi:hypothetical protein